MDLNLFGGWDNLLSVLIRAIIFYTYTIVLLRLAGKRTVAVLTIFDFVSTVAIATIVGTTIISGTIPLLDGLLGLTALVALQWLVAFVAARNKRFYHLITNTPRLLFDGARFLDKNITGERLTQQDVLACVRQSGHPTLESVAAVVLETTGSISVLGTSTPAKPAPLDEDIMDPVAR